MYNLNEFIKELRRYKKSDIVSIASSFLWDIFNNKENKKVDTTENIVVIKAGKKKIKK